METQKKECVEFQTTGLDFWSSLPHLPPLSTVDCALLFFKSIQGTNGEWWWVPYSIWIPCECRPSPSPPQWTHYVWEFDEAYCMDKVSVLCLWLRGDIDIPRSPCFLFKSERRQLCSKTQPTKKSWHIVS